MAAHIGIDSSAIPSQTAAPTPDVSGYPVPVRVLEMGSLGDDVKWLQTRLNQKTAAGIDVDGKYGPATEEAVRAFQQAHGLAADCIFGPATMAELQ